MANYTAKSKPTKNPFWNLLSRLGKVRIWRIGLFEILIIVTLIFGLQRIFNL